MICSTCIHYRENRSQYDIRTNSHLDVRVEKLSDSLHLPETDPGVEVPGEEEVDLRVYGWQEPPDERVELGGVTKLGQRHGGTQVQEGLTTGWQIRYLDNLIILGVFNIKVLMS